MRFSPDPAESHARNETLPHWWDIVHAVDSLSFLTGSHLVEVAHRLEISDRIAPGATVLEVGVGLGYCTRELSSAGCVVQVLDISAVALGRVMNYVEGTYLSPALLPTETFDVAISHLVSQHMLDGTLVAQIREVVRALKPDGLFAMQFAGPKDPPYPELPIDLLAKAGMICRTPEQIETLVTNAGGKLARCVQKDGLNWYAAHIIKGSVPHAER